MENFRLKVFRAAARTLNFRKAAEELLVSQPAVTQQIKALEEELGTSLFERTKGKVKLTASGVILAKHAERIKVILDEAVQTIAENAGTRADELRVGASQTIGVSICCPTVSRLRKDYLRDIPEAKLVWLDAGHFVLDENLQALLARSALRLRAKTLCPKTSGTGLVYVITACHHLATDLMQPSEGKLCRGLPANVS